MILNYEGDFEGFFLCYFENGFENDIFIEKNFGHESLNKMLNIKLDERVDKIRISSLNYLFIECKSSLYKSKLTVKQLIDKF